MNKLDNRKPLIIATDGSVNAKGAAIYAGWAWVASDGRHHENTLRESSPLVAELVAIRDAVAMARLERRPVTILTDSRQSVRAIEAILLTGRCPIRPGSHGAKSASKHLAMIVHDLRQTSDVHVEWVKGHAGHPLNEIADRLARQVRRFGAHGLGDLMPLLDRIAGEALEIVA